MIARARAPYDWQALLGLIRRAFASMEGRIDPPSSLHQLTVETLARQAIEGEIWVAGQNEACMVLTPKPGRLYLGKLAVDPALQGRGLGRDLVTLAEERARNLGYDLLELQTRVELTRNHAIFRKLGFVETGRTAHDGFTRPTSVTFAKKV